jgi:hypothetical protein
MSDREATHSDLGEIAKRNGDLALRLIRDLEKIPQPGEFNDVLGRQNRAD